VHLNPASGLAARTLASDTPKMVACLLAGSRHGAIRLSPAAPHSVSSAGSMTGRRRRTTSRTPAHAGTPRPIGIERTGTPIERPQT
jgi:hypothetical protein